MKKVLITGGNGDIAKAIRALLINEGEYDVYSPGREELDVTDYARVKDIIESFVPDILINNAGYVRPNDISENNYESDKKAIDINLLGTFWCTSVATSINPDVLVINIGSSAGTKVHAEWSAYCAAKAGVIMASKCWAAEGIKVKCISPGRTQSKMRKALFPDEDQNTLLKAEDFAFIVVKAIKGAYEYGENINVNVDNINELKYGTV
jgi:3-oxoacyl-[acyl-carrier protein] reductase